MTSPMGQGSWSTMRSFQRDRSVARQKLRPGTIRRIGEFARPYRRPLAAFLLVVVVQAALGTALPLLFKVIIDEGIIPGRVGLVEALAGVIAVIAVIDAGLSLLQRWLSARIGEGLIFEMRSKVFDHVQRQPLAFFSRTQTGALITRLNNDVLGAQSAFTNTLAAVFSNILTVGFVLAAMFTLSWQVTLIALVLLPVFVVPAKLLAPRLAALTRESYALNAEMNTTMTERFNVAGALLGKLYGDQGREVATFRGQAGRVRDIGVAQAMFGRIFFASMTLVAALATAVVYGVGGRYAAQGHIEVGTIVALTAYLTRLYGPLTQLSNVHVDVMTALVSFERVFEVLDLKPAIEDRPGAAALDVPPGGASVEFDHVGFRYPAASEVSLASLESVAVLDPRVPAPVLRDVTFRVAPGELVALVGPSGAGKTTISQLVPRIYDALDGAVRVGGLDVRDVTLESLRATVGVVTQDAHMFHDTIRANLAFARADATDERMWAALDAAQIGALVRSLPDGLDTVVGDRGYRLSGGEKQRLAIARLLVKEPSVVVLDEATAHLDSESEAAVQRALTAALTGRTALVIAHRLSTVRDADRILVVADGRVVEEGRHADLLARDGLYAELYRTQFADDSPAPAAA
ncbi:ABC transporter ATP-binding protein [Frankia sp. CNm7]|uniref:ABC transporter ATP-binding protein n=1 Tax=Frankia nepalensis TaxID=1836974 RepID=A0A937RNQ4_9ACTN|nr:ABC transporter ATP-binding protein [Frankia nepalensis]MBL7502626.1 ABC transporter ATP-binding protein [Frankia nepalensis]MBL7516151.1 ABC transporter ATP-binding protein [Frankia nepalensis]MBL7522057.1 ABC transporter ATP-binding protein [Frankia nepalensis]MBL7632230.1 ABC transporter ATP-binding protein [Frankia nepalensis]